MNIIRLFSICLLIMNSCVSYSAKNDTNIGIDIFPSGGGEKGYTISLIKDFLTVQVKGLGAVNGNIVLTDVKKEISLKLSKNQLDSIDNYLKNVRQFNQLNKDNAFIMDTWIYVIRINNQEIAKFNSLSLLEKSNEEKCNILKEMIRYLIKISPLKFDLQSFS